MGTLYAVAKVVQEEVIKQNGSYDHKIAKSVFSMLHEGNQAGVIITKRHIINSVEDVIDAIEMYERCN